MGGGLPPPDFYCHVPLGVEVVAFEVEFHFELAASTQLPALLLSSAKDAPASSLYTGDVWQVDEIAARREVTLRTTEKNIGDSRSSQAGM